MLVLDLRRLKEVYLVGNLVISLHLMLTPTIHVVDIDVLLLDAEFLEESIAFSGPVGPVGVLIAARRHDPVVSLQIEDASVVGLVHHGREGVVAPVGDAVADEEAAEGNGCRGFFVVVHNLHSHIRNIEPSIGLSRYIQLVLLEFRELFVPI